MRLEIRGAFLVETFARSNRVRRHARIIGARPDGRVKLQGSSMVDGLRFSVAYHFPPGIKQGHAVAWLKEGK